MLRRSPKPPKPARAREPGHGARPVAVLAELVALGLGVAANLASVWDERTADPAQVWAGGAIPLVLLIATYLFLAHRVPAVWKWDNPGWLAWYANLVSGAAILAPAAMASYWHQRELLLGWDGVGVVLSPGGPLVDVAGAPVWLATLLPLTVDGLAVRAALTLWSRTSTPVAAADSATRRDEPWGGPETVTPREPAPATIAPVTPPSSVTTLRPVTTPSTTPRPPRPARRAGTGDGRNRDELVAAGRLLDPPVRRTRAESVAAFGDRVRAGERAAARGEAVSA